MSSPSHPPSSPPPPSRSQGPHSYIAPKFVSHNSPMASHRRSSMTSASGMDMGMDVDVDPNDPLLDDEESDQEGGRGVDDEGDGEGDGGDFEDEEDEEDEGVDQDIDELISSSDERPPPSTASGSVSRAGGRSRTRAGAGVGAGDGEGSSGGLPKKMRARATKKKQEDLPEWGCRWKGCSEVLDDQESLINHIHQVHLPEGLEEYHCDWERCPRRNSKHSTKQNDRKSLVMHVRIHTGEKPYKCPQEDCDRAFTRNDAMNKHLRTFHAEKHEELKEKKHRQRQATQAASRAQPRRGKGRGDGEPSRSTRGGGGGGGGGGGDKSNKSGGLKPGDKDLMQDPDLADVIPRLRARKKFWTTTEEDERVIADVKASYVVKRASKGLDQDDFDLNSSQAFPETLPPQEALVEGGGAGGEGYMLMGRTKWQVRYIVAKAKLMLVEEENAMRKTQLMDLMDKEAQLLAERDGEQEQEQEQEQEPGQEQEHVSMEMRE